MFSDFERIKSPTEETEQNKGPETTTEHRDSPVRRLIEAAKRYGRIAAALALLSMPVSQAGRPEGENNESRPGSIEAPLTPGQIETPSASGQAFDQKGGIQEGGIHIHHGFLRQGENDKVPKINPWAFLWEPLVLEVRINENVLEQFEIKIPYDLARFFSSVDPSDPRSYERAQEYLQQEILARMMGAIRSLGVIGASEIHRVKHGDNIEGDSRIVSVSVSGFASPEATENESVKPGAIDAKNIKLAKMRREHGREAFASVLETLRQMGVDISQVQEIEGRAEELQFSDAEWSRLRELAEDFFGKNTANDEVTLIMNLVKEYNNGNLDNRPDIKSELDHIISTKRRVEIRVQQEGERPKIYYVPLPLLALLPFFLSSIFRRLKPKKDPIPEIPSEVIDTPLPSDGPKKSKMISDVIYGDIARYYNDEMTIKNGIDYFGMAEHMYQKYDNFDDDEQRINYLTTMILWAWQEHDQALARTHGEEEIAQKLNYLHNRHQIVQAKIHAVELMKLVTSRRNESDKESNDEDFRSIYERLLKERIKALAL